LNPTIYTTYIEQLWISAKAKKVNGERQIQALVDKKKVIIPEMSIRSDLKLDDVEGTNCLPTATIFAELERMRRKGIYIIPSHTKKVFANMKRPGKGFSGKVTPLFETMMVQATKDMEHIPNEATNEEHVATPSCDPPQSGEDRMQHTELMYLCTQLQSRVLALETTKCNHALEIKSLKRRVKSLEKRRKSRTPGFKRLRKGRKIADLDADTKVTLIDETHERYDEEMLFDVQDDLQGEEVVVEKEVAKKEVNVVDLVTTASDVLTTANVEFTTTSAPTTTIDELTLAQTLIEIKAAKPKVVTFAITTTTISRPKARGVKKDQIKMDKEVARNLEAQLQAKLEEEKRISRLEEEKANIALLESWDNIQAMMDADFELAQ
ncbi:hypothetical protein Tco_1469547, partial [Tanacetum coccineum]